jgi:hypothetical protein
MAGLHSVWARDLVIGAWNFHDTRYAGNIREISQLAL